MVDNTGQHALRVQNLKRIRAETVFLNGLHVPSYGPYRACIRFHLFLASQPAVVLFSFSCNFLDFLVFSPSPVFVFSIFSFP